MVGGQVAAATGTLGKVFRGRRLMKVITDPSCELIKEEHAPGAGCFTHSSFGNG